MANEQPLRGVMIGAGYFAGFQAEAWRRVEGAHLVAVADPQPERAEAFARQWDIPVVYTDPAEMLAVERPDFADIVTRPETHPELTALAAAHDAHVICQKPMAPTWRRACGS
jgi:D-apiose dehydrogenase